ncbi:DUF6932 family protein [Mucilaginibacter psychrotolerans]|uniref:Polymerase nucleotidyl transferase domain-containing protein n=1 Tax=Mucilaginibacter psychrotolerans TaxID=1524096 RepID=A0A4Y8SCE3_9SPHI|nr:hypothetical protein [Mucilaginibacter psychrotolerans]TFF36006.1 hypothetical protein E2R66_17465 [Mucilaginibacter psychrotolerans]
MFDFNQRGLLIPETTIACSLAAFEAEFVIRPNIEKRRYLFEQYKLYCNDLKVVCGNSDIKQWIDGSYVTKNKNPLDIDIVSFIDYDIVKAKEKALKQFIYPNSVHGYGIDGYIVVVHSSESKLFYITEADKAY